jgi:hypothetical protein
MQRITQVVELLEDKIHLVVKRYVLLKEENSILRRNLVELQQKLNIKEQLIQEQETDFDSLQHAKTIQGSDNKEKTTKKINILIQEIDKCIAQLSD